MKWDNEMALGVEEMDLTHREFIEQLDALSRIEDAKVVERYAGLIEHTVAHFGRENTWMTQMGYAHAAEHKKEHDHVLRVMGAIARYMENCDYRMGRMAAHRLADWFIQHAFTMDALLAQFLQGMETGPGAPHPASRRRKSAK
jgi:hemerythrin-like metal-binding protein